MPSAFTRPPIVRPAMLKVACVPPRSIISRGSSGWGVMAAAVDVSVFKDGMIVLATAAVFVPLAKRVGITPVVAYLVAGAILGPYGLAALAEWAPSLKWITIQRSDGLGLVGELGVVALLFLIGIELSFQRLMT